MPKERLDNALDQLVSAELVLRRGVPPDAEYTFKHALVQDAAYSTLLMSHRQQRHARVATVLEDRFLNIVEQHPEILAEHYGLAGLMKMSAQQWLRAGRNAAKRAAHREASASFEKALGALANLPVSAETLEESIGVQLNLSALFTHWEN